MYPTQHLILGIIFSIVLLFLFPQIGFLGASIIILSTNGLDKNDFMILRAFKNNLEI